MLTNGVLVTYSPENETVDVFEVEPGDLPPLVVFIQQVPISECASLEWRQVMT